ncbi:MAG TPA: dihydrofolate reductase family protein [Solirubrobacteraceae bacterium]|jgi:riboflavin-specific deaminase-like protein|nr:dihydrofolate reductase family protein [Solirubrobacteraceae bacterium]
MRESPDEPPQSESVSLRSLAPAGPAIGIGQLVERLDLAERAAAASSQRPYVALNMISTADGRATLSGRSGTIGGEADKQLFHGLRTVVDAVMAGAGTVRTEGYRRLVRDPAARETRRRRGLSEEPLACVVSGRLALGEQIPLLADPEARVAILTASQDSLPAACRARIEYVRCALAAGAAGGGQLDLAAAMRELRGRFGVRTLLCEGGPHLNAHLLATGLVDELFLSLAPTLAGGDAVRNGTDCGGRSLRSHPRIGQRRRRVSPDFGSESLRIVSGLDLDPPVAMELVSAHEHSSHLFLRYRINR